MSEKNQEEIQVINYLDTYVAIKNGKLEKYSSINLQNAFPNIDEFSLNLWEKEWRAARRVMLDIKF